MANTSLPSLFVLQANEGKYATVTYDQYQEGVVKFVEDDVFSRRAKFAAEQSKTGDGTLVHIRSCFNNKYCVAVPAIFSDNTSLPGAHFIAAIANKPQEETTDPACTLFRVSTHSTGFRFFSVSKSQYLFPMFVFLSVSDGSAIIPEEIVSTFRVIDWEKLVFLPSQVSFKSEDGKYLCARVVDGGNYFYFESGRDIGSREVGFELIHAPNGNYHIKSLYFGKYLSGVNNEWIVADQNDVSDATLFSFTKIKDNIVSLSYLRRKMFCGGDKIHNSLRAYYTDLVKETKLIVEHHVVRRDISIEKYLLEDSKIHDEYIEVAYNEFITNATDKENTATFEYSETESNTTSWNNSLSSSIGASVSVGFEVGWAPYVINSEVKLSTEFGGSYQWGESNTSVKESKTTHDVLVPPSSTIKISFMVTKSVCEVPFKYIEKVLYADGVEAIEHKDDGIFKGIKAMNFYVTSSKVDDTHSIGNLIGNM